ncbi:hypothetical protein NKH77_21295 [Streptomyces sp. M19]
MATVRPDLTRSPRGRRTCGWWPSCARPTSSTSPCAATATRPRRWAYGPPTGSGSRTRSPNCARARAGTSASRGGAPGAPGRAHRRSAQGVAAAGRVARGALHALPVLPDGRLVLGWAHGCDVEFWEHATWEGPDGPRPMLLAPRPNRAADAVPEHAPP